MSKNQKVQQGYRVRGRRSPQPVTRCRGRSCRRRSDAMRRRARWGRCRRLPGCRCRGGHPAGGGAGGDVNTRVRELSTEPSPTELEAAPYPVDDEDLADAELVLELFGGDGHGVEVAETPEGRRGRGVNDGWKTKCEGPQSTANGI